VGILVVVVRWWDKWVEVIGSGSVEGRRLGGVV